MTQFAAGSSRSSAARDLLANSPELAVRPLATKYAPTRFLSRQNRNWSAAVQLFRCHFFFVSFGPYPFRSRFFWTLPVSFSFLLDLTRFDTGWGMGIWMKQWPIAD